jgi:NADP-dependent 3-hydroxy acid dehydrogenase YdfG
MREKNILITGASAGIGKACADRFAENGNRLFLIARRMEKLRSIQKDLERKELGECNIYEADICDREKIQKICNEIVQSDRVPDLLVNNAGLASGLSKIQDGDFDDWDTMIDTNIKGVLNITRFLLPEMIKRNSGHIVNLGSVAGHIVYPNGNVYCATKFAVRALNMALNYDLLGTKIKVTSVDPGAVETEFSEVRFHGDKKKAASIYEGYDVLQAEDVADVVYYVFNTPPHVNIQNVVMLSTDQRSPYLIHKNQENK